MYVIFHFLMQMIFSHVISAVNEAFSYKTACFIFRAVLAESSRNHQCHCETEFVIVHFFFFQDACPDSACVFPVLDIRESTSTTTYCAPGEDFNFVRSVAVQFSRLPGIQAWKACRRTACLRSCTKNLIRDR